MVLACGQQSSQELKQPARRPPCACAGLWLPAAALGRGLVLQHIDIGT